MNILAARFVNTGDHMAIEITTDQGIAYLESPKRDFTAAGFAILGGPEVFSGKVDSEIATLPADFTDGRWTSLELMHATYDPVIVDMARRWQQGELNAVDGEPVEVRTLVQIEARK